MKILMTGATGLLGKKLGLELSKLNHDITIISRSEAQKYLPFKAHVIKADLGAQSVEINTEFDVVINLLGEGIGDGRWTDAKKKRIYNSRIVGTRNLIKSLQKSPKVFISSSAIGYYGDRGDEKLNIDSNPGDGFLPTVVRDWEFEAKKIEDKFPNVRTVLLRTGIVLSPSGGALEKMLPVFNLGVGSALGNGKQWMSWIHIEDWVSIVLKIISDQNFSGPINMVSSQAVTNHDFSKILAELFGYKLRPNVPGFVLKLAMGEMSTLVLDSARVELNYNCQIKFQDLESAMKDCIVLSKFQGRVRDRNGNTR